MLNWYTSYWFSSGTLLTGPLEIRISGEGHEDMIETEMDLKIV